MLYANYVSHIYRCVVCLCMYVNVSKRSIHFYQFARLGYYLQMTESVLYEAGFGDILLVCQLYQVYYINFARISRYRCIICVRATNIFEAFNPVAIINLQSLLFATKMFITGSKLLGKLCQSHVNSNEYTILTPPVSQVDPNKMKTIGMLIVYVRMLLYLIHINANDKISNLDSVFV